MNRETKWVRRANVWLGALILACAMILSYSHTADLFRWAFYEGWLAHVGVIMVELTFFLGAMNVILSRSVGLAAGWPARMAFMFGALLVGWSNVSSGKMFFSREETAVMLGLAIPICLFLMEAIVSRALFQFRTQANQAAAASPAASANQEAASRQVDGQAARVINQAIKQAGNQAIQANQADRMDKQEDRADANQTTEQDDQANQTENQASKTPTRHQAKQAGSQAGDQATRRTRRAPGVSSIEEQKARRVALQLLEENGQLPGRYKLANRAGVRESVARRVLENLRAVQAAEGGART